ncbi:acid phosphatase det1 [Borealophlyctis nickersoniae]|nr:acid phosphatase det1 [Borealophlyctis nickersoniae]
MERLYNYHPGGGKPHDANSAFSEVFSLRYEVNLTAGSEVLCRDFSLFTADKRYMIVASAVQSTGTPEDGRRYPNSLRCINSLDDVTFWILDLATGRISDKRTFKNDYIYLTNHAGVHLFGQILGITSVQNQAIYLLHVKDSGQFVDLRTVGWFNYEDDELVLGRYREAEEQHQRKRRRLESSSEHESTTGSDSHFWEHMAPLSPGGDRFPTTAPMLNQAFPGFRPASALPRAPFTSPAAQRRHLLNDATIHQVPTGASSGSRTVLTSLHVASPVGIPAVDSNPKSVPLSGLKHRVMAYLYKRALSAGKASAINHFYLTFAQFSSLVMWRMQFLDDSHIMIKFGSLDNILGRTLESAASQISFFVIYSLETTAVLGVYENCSETLLKMFQQWDCFRGLPYDDPVQFVTSPSNNQYAREAVAKHMHAVKKAKNGGAAQAIRRVLSALPINPQSFVDSPYFDHSLFSYDEKTINSCDRARPNPDFPIKFYDRRRGSLKFKLDANPTPPVSTPAGTRPQK